MSKRTKKENLAKSNSSYTFLCIVPIEERRCMVNSLYFTFASCTALSYLENCFAHLLPRCCMFFEGIRYIYRIAHNHIVNNKKIFLRFLNIILIYYLHLQMYVNGCH